jgi:hypothetical protein
MNPTYSKYIGEVMLLKYGMKNFSSFKEGVEVSFELKECAREKIGNGPVTNVMCVNGANGSGKTNLLKGLSFLGYFCAHSFDNKPDSSIPFDSYFFNNDPTDFYIEFKAHAQDYIYKYECTITKKRILSEKLFRKKKRETIVVERVEDKITACIKEFEALCQIKKIRGNASIISIANQHEIDSIAPFYNFFQTFFSNVGYTGLLHTFSQYLNENQVSKLYYEDEVLFNYVKKMICKSDLGISDIAIEPFERENEEVRYVPTFTHINKKQKKFLPYHAESSGTKSLYINLFRYWLALEIGGILILDEFDINLHPHMLPMLLECFTDPELNKHNAQLIFTTHNTEILDVMGKYRTFLVNKDDNESFGYRLDEIPGELLRNDRSISPIYNAGKIGGVPKL